jgi:glycogen phosphorylase
VLRQIRDGFSRHAGPAALRAGRGRADADGEHFLCLADYEHYVDTQERVDEEYRDSASWTRKAIVNTASMGRFSSDRAIREYAERIWELGPIGS